MQASQIQYVGAGDLAAWTAGLIAHITSCLLKHSCKNKKCACCPTLAESPCCAQLLVGTGKGNLEEVRMSSGGWRRAVDRRA